MQQEHALPAPHLMLSSLLISAEVMSSRPPPSEQRHLRSEQKRLAPSPATKNGSPVAQLERPNTGQILEQLWSPWLNRGAAQREGSSTPSTVEWQPLYPEQRVPGSNPQPLPEIRAYHGLGRVEVPAVALACAPNASAHSAPVTSIVVAPGGAYKFIGVPGKPEADSVPNTHL